MKRFKSIVDQDELIPLPFEGNGFNKKLSPVLHYVHIL